MKKLLFILMLIPFIGFGQSKIRNTQITSGSNPNETFLKSDGATNAVWDSVKISSLKIDTTLNLKEYSIYAEGQQLPLSNGGCQISTLVDNGDGTVTLSSGDYHLSANVSGKGSHKYTLVGGTFTMTDQSQNYIVADYNSGSPLIKVITDVTLINETTVVPIYSIYRSGNYLHTQNWDALGLALSNKIHQSIVKTQRYRRESGISLSEYGTHNLNLSVGRIWTGAVPITLDAIATATDNLFFFRHVGGTWSLTVQPTYNFTQYDNGTNLVTLTNNRYAVNWVFRGVESQKHLYIVIGTGDYSEPQAISASLPAIPVAISSHAVLVAKLIVQKNAATSTSIQSAFDTQFGLSAIQSHVDLTGRDVVDSHPAGAITNTPSGTITATDNQTAINQLDAKKEPIFSKGNLTENITGLEFSSTRQVIGGATTLTVSTGYVIPTTTNISHAETSYTHSQNDADLSITNELDNATHTGDATGATALTLATVNNNIGTYNNVTINAKGLATAGSNVAYLTTEVDGSVTNEIQAPTRVGDLIGLTQTTTTISIADKEPAFSKNTAFNKNFGTTAGTVLEGRTFGTAANSATTDFAPASGSGNYIQNQNAIHQTANLDITGSGYFGTGLNIASGQTYKVNGTQISSANLSDASNLAKLNTANIFTQSQSINSTGVTGGLTLNGGNTTGAGGGFTQYKTDAINKMYVGTETAAIGGTSGGGMAYVYDNFPFKVNTNNVNRLTINGDGTSVFSSTVSSTNYKLSNVTTFLDWSRTGFAGTSGQVLLSQGISTTPAWSSTFTSKMMYSGSNTFSNDRDLVDKAYVDAVASGNLPKLPVDAATTGNITLSGTQTIDTYSAGVGARILVWKQTTASQNGVYIVAAGAWVRATDLDTWAELYKAYVAVLNGTQTGSSFVCTIPSSGTLGTTEVTWVLYNVPTNILAGTGLTKTGNTISLNIATASALGGIKAGSGTIMTSDVLSVTPTSIGLPNVENTALSAWPGSSNLTTLGTIGSGIWQGSDIADSYISSSSIWNAKESALTFTTGLIRVGNTISSTITQYTDAFARASLGTGTGYAFNDGSNNYSFSYPEGNTLRSTGSSENQVLAADGTNGALYKSLKTINGNSIFGVGNLAISSGDVFKVGTPTNTQLGIWTGDGTIKGTNNLNFIDNTTYHVLDIKSPAPVLKLSDSDYSPVRNSTLEYDGSVNALRIYNFDGTSTTAMAKFTPTGSNLYNLPNTTSANILYYDSATGAMSYASAPATSGMVWPTGSGIPLVSGGSSWGTTIALPNNTTQYLRADGTFSTPTFTSQWNNDANGINYQAGNVAIGTTSISNAGVYVNKNLGSGYGGYFANTGSGVGLVAQSGSTGVGSVLYAVNGGSNIVFDVRGNGTITMPLLTSDATPTDIVYWNNGVLSHGAKPSGSGGVSSVSASTITTGTGGNFATASVSNPTTTPAISYTLASQTANLVLASQDGASGAPSYRKIVTNDISAAGTPGSTTALFGDGSWKTVNGTSQQVYSVPNGSIVLTGIQTSDKTHTIIRITYSVIRSGVFYGKGTVTYHSYYNGSTYSITEENGNSIPGSGVTPSLVQGSGWFNFQVYNTSGAAIIVPFSYETVLHTN